MAMLRKRFIQMRRLFDLFLLKDGRKVGLGLWILVLSSLFLGTGKISAGDWVGCLSMSSILVGGGTVADTYLKGKNAPPPAG
jgi:hypothetical protein